LVKVGGTGTVAVLGDVDGPPVATVAAGADGVVGAGDPDAKRASRAFNAIALFISSTSFLAIQGRTGVTYLLRSASALAPPGPGSD
jgi:hypothetical protein